MNAYQLHGPGKVCAITGRTFAPGDSFFSVLLEVENRFERKDIAPEAWTGAPTEAIAWWKGVAPKEGKNEKPTINDELLIDCFEHLTDRSDTNRQHFRYIVALLLMRRKRFRFEDSRKDGAQETLVLRDAKSGKKHEVVDPKLTDAEMDQVQDEVFRVLGWS